MNDDPTQPPYRPRLWRRIGHWLWSHPHVALPAAAFVCGWLLGRFL